MRSAIVLFLASWAVVATGAHSEATNCLGTTPADCQRSEIVGGDYAMRSFAGGNFSNALVRDVSFAQSDLVVSVFDGARLESVNFREANLVGASFSGATLIEVIRGSFSRERGAPCATQARSFWYGGEPALVRSPPPCAMPAVAFSRKRLLAGSILLTRLPAANFVNAS